VTSLTSDSAFPIYAEPKHNNLAYGFDYDDVFDQSTSINDANPSKMTINVTWN
jgi:hypothetical protein